MDARESGVSESHAWWKGRAARLGCVFLVALLGLLAVAGAQAFLPSKDNHFVHLADGWLHGRLHHEGPPPGYCTPEARRERKCRDHTFDDWARVKTLTFRDGTQARGFPCETPACKQARKEHRPDTWWILGEGWTEIPRGSIATTQETWYVSFPPGPALLMLPFVAVWGIGTWDVLLTALAAALIPVVLVDLLDRERARHWGHLAMAAAWTFASPAFFLAANGRVWFTAQVVGALMLALYLRAAFATRLPLQSGVWLVLAIACRPHMALAALFFAMQWWSGPRELKTLIRFAVPLVLGAMALMLYNEARFDDPFEFGHRFLVMRWQGRVQEYGFFSVTYLSRNLSCLLTLLPKVRGQWPWLAYSIHGSALWFGAPWVVAFLWARRRFAGRAALWLTALALAIPPLLYQNSGQRQFTYRFAVDWLPAVVLALALGGAARRPVLLIALVVVGALLQVHGAYGFDRLARELFVWDPFGWPFEAEFET